MIVFPALSKGKFKVCGSRTLDIGEYPFVKDSVQVFHFNFVNSGDSLLTIVDVVPNCVCMEASWTQQPLAPGDTGSIYVLYKANKPGHFKHMVTVVGNGFPEWDYIYVEGTAIEMLNE